MEGDNLPDTEFEVMILRKFHSMKNDIETMKKDQSEIKTTISEMKNTLEGINSRLDKVDPTSNLKVIETNTQSEQQKEKTIFRIEGSLRHLWDNMKYNNICIIGMPEGEEKEQGIKKLLEEIKTETSLTWSRKNKNKNTSPGSTESPKQDRPKETHSKTHHS